MSCRLRTYDVVPPGGYPFENYKGIYRRFPSEPLIEAQAQIVSQFRQANGIPRASVAECLEDVDIYTCRRLGCDHRFCTGSSVRSGTTVALNASSPIVAPCGGCGAKVP